MLNRMVAPTVDQVLESLGEYADYETANSVERARLYRDACRRFLALPSSSAEQGSSAGYAPQYIQQELEFARRWIAQNDTSSQSGGGSRFLSTREGFRR